LQVGVIGCGNISGIYLQNAKRFRSIEVVSVADLVPERALTQATEYGVPNANTPDQILSNDEIRIILNLTTPVAHAGIAKAALQAGKSVYNEKPLTIQREDAAAILKLAKERDLRVGCAPDTFLGAGMQTARQLLDSGKLGEPVAAMAFMVSHGPEHWHPDPDFYYHVGGGPLFDMGPYYLTALMHLLGPVKRVCGSAQISFAERTIRSEKRAGEKVKVETPTHISAVLDFANGAVLTLIMSFDVWHHNLPLLELHGSEASVSLPDPNFFGGPVRIRGPQDEDWQEVPLAFDYAENDRGVGLADMAHAMQSGRGHRANGELAFHVLDVMHAILESARSGRHVELQSSCHRPAPMPTGLPEGVLDD
jgi:predicted dehydrogenase